MLLSAQDPNTWASCMRALDLVPPCRFTWALAVILSVKTSTCWPATRSLNSNKASLMALNSNQLMLMDVPVKGHSPWANRAPKWAPHPDKLASVVSVTLSSTQKWQPSRTALDLHQASDLLTDPGRETRDREG